MDDKSTQEQSGKKKKSWKKILKTSVVFIPLLFLSLILVPQFDVVSDFPPSLILYEDLILLLVLGIPVILSVVFYQYFIPKKYGLLIFMSGIIGFSFYFFTSGHYYIGFTDLSKSWNSGVSTRTSTTSSKSKCNVSEAERFAESRFSVSGTMVDGPFLGKEPVGCRYYFWAGVMSSYGTMKQAHIVVSAESGEWEVISVEVR